MKLLLARHAQTLNNRHKILQGHLPVPLDAKGKAQARKLAVRLAKERIDAIYSSDLPRAAQTTKIIALYHPHTRVRYDKSLRERDAGAFDGQPQQAMRDDLAAKKANVATYVPPGGESRVQVQKRMLKAFRAIEKRHANGTVLIVSHGASLNALLCALLGKPINKTWVTRYSLKNASLTTLDVRGRRAKLVEFDSTRHLR